MQRLASTAGRTVRHWNCCVRIWLDAPDLDAEKRIAVRMQQQMWRDVPYIPLGHWVRSAAHRRNIVDIPWGFPAFYGVRRI